jgi:NADH-quinone oxidoreductase subunit C
MIAPLAALAASVQEHLGEAVTATQTAHAELAIELRPDALLEAARTLRDHPALRFEQLMDLCGVDYLDYGQESAAGARTGPRFAVVYHLLSLSHNRRLRVRVFLEGDPPIVDSVAELWPAANWYEREAFDLYGIVFEGHPDLRRLLTDYGFVGHPFRKDFPLTGQVEMRYDPERRRVVYQPVTIEPRVLVPRVIREEGFGA